MKPGVGYVKSVERRRCGTGSTEYVFWIIGDPVFLEQQFEFLFEGHLAMMCGLSADVFDDGIDVGMADAECPYPRCQSKLSPSH